MAPGSLPHRSKISPGPPRLADDSEGHHRAGPGEPPECGEAADWVLRTGASAGGSPPLAGEARSPRWPPAAAGCAHLHGPPLAPLPAGKAYEPLDGLFPGPAAPVSRVLASLHCQEIFHAVVVPHFPGGWNRDKHSGRCYTWDSHPAK
jgi:hypothetical protein